MKRLSAACVCLLLAAALPAHALVEVEGDTTTLDITGHAKTFTLVLWQYALAGAPASVQAAVTESLRLNATVETHERFRAEVAYNLFPSVGGGSGAQLNGLIQPIRSPLRVADFDPSLYSSATLNLNHNFDRLNVRGQFGPVEVRAGRLALGFGSARLFNTADIFAPFSPATLDNEYKLGVDGVRVIAALGELWELEATAIGHRTNMARGIYTARGRVSLPGVDISLFAGTSYLTPVVGLDVAGDLGGAGVYGEVVYRYWTERAWRTEANLGVARQAHVARATAGTHYQITEDLGLIGELHYNGGGGAEPRDYLELFGRPEYRAGEVSFLGRYYAALSLTYRLSDLWMASLSGMVNVADPSALITPGLSWDFGENTQVGFGCLVPVGARPRSQLVVAPGSAAPQLLLVPQSEFGLYPVTAYTDLRIYF